MPVPPFQARFLTGHGAIPALPFPKNLLFHLSAYFQETPVITVTGKAFFDVSHSRKDQQLNRRSHLPGYAAWEIHPVMKLTIQ
jgi:hypothetical protein